MRRFPWLLLALAGCGADDQYMVVTVDGRAAVHGVEMLRIELTNEGSSQRQDFPVSSSFPLTFSISPTGRTGDLDISVNALDADGLLVGRGALTTAIDAPTAALTLEPADFVVNTEYAEDQQLSNYYGANGFQLSATADGLWTAVYNANCRVPCNVFGRRFDANGRPLNSSIAASSQGFPISAELTTSYSTPAVATAGNATVTVWNMRDPVAASYSIECRAIDTNGAALTGQVQVSTDEYPNLVSVAPLPNGNFAIVWDGRVTNTMIRGAIVRPDCTKVGLVNQISQNVAGDFTERSHVAANADRILYAWILDGSVHVRIAMTSGTFTIPDLVLVPATANEIVEFVRVAPVGSGFALIVRWVLATGATGPGRLEMYRINNAGVQVGTPTLVSERSGTDGDSSESFGVAARPDGTLLVVWHSCGDKGDGSLCGVFGRVMRSNGLPAGDEFGLATTTSNDQIGPSAVALPDGAFATAWTDKSMSAPDTSGTAVRARIIYPAIDGTSP